MKHAITLLAVLVLGLFAAWFLTTRRPGMPTVSQNRPPLAPLEAATGQSQPEPRADLPGGTAFTTRDATVPSFAAPAGPAPSDYGRSSPSAADAPEAPLSTPSSTLIPGATRTGSAVASNNVVAEGEIEYEIPAGMRAPAVFLPEDRPLTPPMQRFLDDVRREFDAKIASADDPATVWEEARQHADARYLLLFGADAYNRKTMQDAIEALRSKGALPTPPAADPTTSLPAP